MPILQGSCHCGQVRFELPDEFEGSGFCHCTTCKKLSGGGATANARVRTETIRVVSGRELIRTYQPPEGTAKSFCSNCGSNLFGFGWPESEFTSVRLTAIDSPFEQRPQRHGYVRSLAPWETLPDDGLERVD